jgi:hypothetical protein
MTSSFYSYPPSVCSLPKSLSNKKKRRRRRRRREEEEEEEQIRAYHSAWK